MDVGIEMFNVNKRFDWDFYLEKGIKNLESLKQVVKEPQTLCYTGLDVVNFYGDYRENHEYAVSSYKIICFAREKMGWNGKDIRTFLLENSTEDSEWTEWRNRKYKDVFYRKITLSEQMQNIIIEEATRVQNEMKEALINEQARLQAEHEREESERAELLKDVDWKIKEHFIADEGGKTVEYTHTLTINNTSYTIIERNVFDFGRVMNSPKGGMYSRQSDTWVLEHYTKDEGWMPTEIPTDEQRAAQIVCKYGKFAKASVRM